ncbi:MAG: Rieske 2Fe-2S domain-containing protein [Acidobacteriota bacterium]|nr:Rieske 2Fe-2S domain-containing protein [Blastocatellia bacterium]MDW8412011.1 Rieske 2Fe-2S domain-containing protein [Acidobacteriota bacterium]
MTRYIKLLETHAVNTDRPAIVSYAGRRIAVYRYGDTFRALDDICPHMGAFISHGHREGCLAVCPRHNWRFDIATGKCLDRPGVSVELFAIFIEDGWICLPVQETAEIDLADLEAW